MEQYEQKGFLNSSFKIFHLKDRKLRDFTYHYHAFHKLLILIKGNVTYHIDGRSYRLEPYDIVFVHAGEVHRPQIEEIFYFSNKKTPYLCGVWRFANA